MNKKILIIGGTQEGNKLAKILHHYNFNYIISYAGIVNKIHEKTFKKRIGGFGGKDGIIDYIKKNNVTHVIDASHPFSIKISLNTKKACENLKIPVIAFTRKPWFKKKNDIWIRVKNFKESTNFLKGDPKRVFLAIGKNNLEIYKNFNQHFYLLRLLEDKVKGFFANQKCIIAKGPFNKEEDKKLLKKNNIELIITKNSGGSGAYSKIVAARELKITVIIISRPISIQLKRVYNLNSIIDWLNYES